KRDWSSDVCSSDLLGAVSLQCEGEPLHKRTEILMHNTGLLDFYQQEKDAKSKDRVENLQEFVSATQQFGDEDVEDGQDVLVAFLDHAALEDRKSTRLNSSHVSISSAV